VQVWAYLQSTLENVPGGHGSTWLEQVSTFVAQLTSTPLSHLITEDPSNWDAMPYFPSAESSPFFTNTDAMQMNPVDPLQGLQVHRPTL
tara:strand:+ start:411 stop:677 length:267 start_codon:yes stop_codon:yes gene_type:complete